MVDGGAELAGGSVMAFAAPAVLIPRFAALSTRRARFSIGSALST